MPKPLSETLPFMSMPVDNWLAATMHLTLAEYAILHKLHCQAWRRGGELPFDPTATARLAGVSSEELKAAWPAIERWFVTNECSRSMILPELETERRRAIELRDQKRRGAATTNAKRWGAPSHSESESESQSESHSDSDSESLTSRPYPNPHPYPNPPPNPQPHTQEEEEEGPGRRGRNQTPGDTGARKRAVTTPKQRTEARF